MTEAAILLTVSLALLQAVDVWSTNRVLAAPGGREMNGLMRAVQEKFGKAWWVPKLAVVVAGVVACWYFLPPAFLVGALVLLNGWYGYFMAGNLAAMK